MSDNAASVWIAAIIFGALVTVLVIFGTKDCEAADNYLIFHSVSKHSKSTENGVAYNESNYSIGFEHNKGKHGYTAFAYKDSYNTYAKVIGGIYMPIQGTYGSLGILYGVVHSPSYMDGDILPAALPRYEYKLKQFAVNVLFLPKFKKNGAYVFGMQFKYRVK